MSGHQPVNVADFERLAAERIEAGALGYFAGGAGDERTLRRNAEAYGEWELIPRVLVDVSAVDSSIELFGSQLSMPLAQAPVAFQRLVHSEGEEAMARAAGAAGTAMCLSTIATATPASVAAAAPDTTKWFQLYVFSDRAVTEALLAEAVESGYEAIFLTVDAPFAGRRERDLRAGFEVDVDAPSVTAAIGSDRPVSVKEVFSLVDASLDWDDLASLVAGCELPVVVKGLMHPADAELAIEAGAAGVVVSNHGGRQLDGVPATIDALPAVAEAVDGSRARPRRRRSQARYGRACSSCARSRCRARGPARPVGLSRGWRERRAGGARDPQGRDQAWARAAWLPDARGCHARPRRPGAKRLERDRRGRPPGAGASREVSRPA